MEALGKCARLPQVKIAFSAQHFRYNALRAYLGKIRLPKLVLLHHETQHIDWRRLRELMMRTFIFRNEQAQDMYKASQFVLLISASSVE